MRALAGASPLFSPCASGYRVRVADAHAVQFVSRAGVKLDHALREFSIDVTSFICADFGCNIGGFTDCLLQRGAAKVFAIDTGYGALAWKLRNDPRVVVMERTNALHVNPPLPLGEGRGEGGQESLSASRTGVDLVVIDLAWTPQKHAIPAALKWLPPLPPPFEGGGQGVGAVRESSSSAALQKTPAATPHDPPTPGPSLRGRGESLIISLIKPHYELDEDEKRLLLHSGRLDPMQAERVLHRVMDQMPCWGAEVLAHTRSPLTGGKSSKAVKGEGNVEFLVMARRVMPSAALSQPRPGRGDP